MANYFDPYKELEEKANVQPEQSITDAIKGWIGGQLGKIGQAWGSTGEGTPVNRMIDKATTPKPTGGIDMNNPPMSTPTDWLDKGPVISPQVAAITNQSSGNWRGVGAANDYTQMAIDEAKRQGVDPDLVTSIMKFENTRQNPNAISKKGATGLMQVLPETAGDYGVRPEELTVPERNIFAGISHLKKLSGIFGGDVDKMVTAYHMGQGNVLKGVAPGPQTVAYRSRVLPDYFKKKAGDNQYLVAEQAGPNANVLAESPIGLPENRNEGAMTAMEGPNVLVTPPVAEGMAMPEKIPGVNWSQATQQFYPGYLDKLARGEETLSSSPDVLRIGENGLTPVRTADRKYTLPWDEKDIHPVPKGGIESIMGNERLMTDEKGNIKEIAPYQGYALDRRKEDMARAVVENAINEPTTLGMHKKYDKTGNLLEESPVVNPRAGQGMYGGLSLMGGVGGAQKAAEANDVKAELARLGIEKAEAARMAQDIKIYATRPQWNEESQKYDQIFDPSKVGVAYKLLKAQQSGDPAKIEEALKEYHSGGQKPKISATEAAAELERRKKEKK